LGVFFRELTHGCRSNHSPQRKVDDRLGWDEALGALTVFPRLTQLRVSRRENANFVVPYEIDDDLLQPLLRNGTLYVSPAEWAAAQREDPAAWPLMSAVTVAARRPQGST
jgi:hypothetical protein